MKKSESKWLTALCKCGRLVLASRKNPTTIILAAHLTPDGKKCEEPRTVTVK